jgi:hypothetical protein
MSQAHNPQTNLVLSAADHHHPSHPMVDIAPNEQPFTWLKNPNVNQYSWAFNNELGTSVRIFMMGFTTSENDPLWTYTNSVVFGLVPIFRATDFRSSTTIWVGAWWDDGTFAANADGVKAYFRAHPNSAGHHTVPVIVGSST